MFASHIGLGRWAFTGKFWPILSIHSQGALPLTQQASCANSKVNSPVISEAANFSHNSNIRMKALWVKKKKKNSYNTFTHSRTHSYNDGRSCHARCRPAHQEQFQVQYLAQRYFNVQREPGNLTSNLIILDNPLYLLRYSHDKQKS